MSVAQIPVETNIVVSGTRLYEPIRNICLVSDAFAFASNALNEMRPTWTAGQGVIMSGNLPRANVVIPYGVTFQAALFEQEEPPVWVRLTWDEAAEVVKAKEGEGHSGPWSRLVQFFDDAASVQFVMYYERFSDWVGAKASADMGRYDPTWDFARVVRNAISHAGIVNFRNKLARPVEWEGLI